MRALAIVVVVAACAPAKEGLAPLAEGAVVLYRGMPLGGVDDVARNGDHVAVLLGAYKVAISHDLGASFAIVATSDPPWHGVHVSSTGRVHVVRRSGEGPAWDWQFVPIDGAGAVNTVHGRYPADRGDRVETYDYPTDRSSLLSWNAASGEVAPTSIIASRLFETLYVPTAAGFVGYGTDTVKICRYEVAPRTGDPASTVPGADCIDTVDLPIVAGGLTWGAEMIVSGYQAFSNNGQAKVLRIMGGKSEPPIDAGPGTVLMRYREHLHPPFADLLPIGPVHSAVLGDDQHVERLVRVDPGSGSITELSFPRTPCSSDAACGMTVEGATRYGKLLFLTALDGDEYLAFYEVRDSSMNRRYVVRRVRPTVRPSP